MKSIYKITLIILFLITFSCNEKKEKNENTNQKTSLRLDWITNMSFSGDVIAKYETSKDEDLDIELNQSSFGIDPIKMVITGENDFGIVSLENLILANEKGAEIVAIGLINHISPTVFLAKGDKQFSEPKDFEGKVVGLNPGGATENVYRAFKNLHTLENITELPTDFDIKPFINDKYDIRLAFAYVEPIDLDNSNVEFKIIRPEDFGLKFPGRVYFTTKKMIKNNPELVQKFVNSVAKGWEIALESKEKSMKYLLDYDDKVNLDREKKSYDLGMYYYKGVNDKVLSFDGNTLKDFESTLFKLNLIKETNIESQINYSFIKKYHSK